MIALILTLTLCVYTRGVWHLWNRLGGGRGVKRWQAAAHFGGIVTLAVALVSPLDSWSEALFTAHMVQHLLLMLVAAPLIAFSQPLVALLWGLTQRWRHAFRGWQRFTALSAAERFVTMPLVAWILHTFVLWFWHLPGPYQAALYDGATHILEHSAFFGTALFYWLTFARAPQSPIRRYGWGMGSLFTMGLQSSLLGALLTFSRAPWYSVHAETTSRWGLTPLEDQQLAGLIMWIPAGTVYIVAALTLLLMGLQAVERRTRLREEGTG
jgi:putative membrane protein